MNAIGRVHEYLEAVGGINFGAPRPSRYRHHAIRHHHHTLVHTREVHNSTIDETPVVSGPRKRRIRTRTGDW